MKHLFAVLSLFASTALAQVGPVPGSGGGSISSGSAIGSCTSSLLYTDASTLLGCNPAAVVNGSVSTAGRSILTIRDTISGSSATSNFLNITGSFPATLSAETNAVNVVITGDNDASNQNGIKATLDGSTGTNGKYSAIYGVLSGAGTLNNWSAAIKGEAFLNSASKTIIGGQFGASSVNAGTGSNVALSSYAGENGSAPTLNNGIQAGAKSGTATNAIGGYFFLNSTAYSSQGSFDPIAVTGTSALVADNKAIAANIFEARDNGAATSTTAASANVTILDGAQMRLGPMALTSSTMTPSIVSEARTVTHAYAWTNAMVTALGASTTGDVNVATLPAKTRVEMAYIVIDSPDSSANALTVGCGDTGAGAVNYVKAGDAKAAANTVYGDNITGSETGTSLFSTFFITNYVPSYTATTTVSCRFTKTTSNLNTVTGSTGRVILITSLLP